MGGELWWNSKVTGRRPQQWEVEGSAGSSLAILGRAESGVRAGSSVMPVVAAD